METKELNRAIKRFAQEVSEARIDPYSEAAKAEFTRLSGADPEMKYINKESVITLFVMNRAYHFVPFTIFGPSSYY
jgi:hypothetical protein